MEKVENRLFSCKMANSVQGMQKKPQTKQTHGSVHGVKKVPKKINSVNITRGFVCFLLMQICSDIN